MQTERSCPGCGVTIFFDGLCWQCNAKQRHKTVLEMNDSEIEEKLSEMCLKLGALHGKTASWKELEQALTGFQDLLAYQEINTAALAKIACEREIYSHTELYRNADASVREKLISVLHQPCCKNAGEVQMALAIIGGQEVQQLFMKLEKSPLPWREDLYVNPSIYAESGGWSFDEKGQRQTLVFDTCYAMHKGNKSQHEALQIGKKRNECCKGCGCQMLDILVLDGKDDRLSFLGIDGTLRVPFCPWCGCFAEESVIRYQLDGTGSYEAEVDPRFAKSKVPSKYIDEIAENNWVLDEKPCPVYRSYGDEEAPTIGGMAKWVQDWMYLTCPDCGKKMRYLFTIPWGCISKGFEGSLYFEICTDCQIVKVIHQQT